MEMPDEIWLIILSFIDTPISYAHVDSQLYRLCRAIADNYRYLCDIHARDIPMVLRWRWKILDIGDKHQLLSNIVADGDRSTISCLYRLGIITRSDLVTLVSTYLEMGDPMAYYIHITFLLLGKIVEKKRRCIVS